MSQACSSSLVLGRTWKDWGGVFERSLEIYNSIKMEVSYCCMSISCVYKKNVRGIAFAVQTSMFR